MLVPRFHLITPCVDVALLRDLVRAGVDAIQVRDKAADDRTLFAFVAAVLDAVGPLGVRVLVNDRVDLALATGADGVHLGLTDLPVAAARSLGPELLIGATCRSRTDAVAAARDGADFVGVGPVFTTTTKIGLPEPIGPDGLGAVAGVLPMIAVAGLDAARVPGVLAVGAHGVAVAGAVARAPDPIAAAEEIATALRAA